MLYHIATVSSMVAQHNNPRRMCGVYIRRRVPTIPLRPLQRVLPRQRVQVARYEDVNQW